MVEIVNVVASEVEPEAKVTVSYAEPPLLTTIIAPDVDEAKWAIAVGADVMALTFNTVGTICETIMQESRDSMAWRQERWARICE
ncbi:hypothetical protein A2160_01490 [Candidatus Beckwithbacteria bacterium RBG_13_42_9]|uniref:Uncharacterized protein n=1 Tax=Candidatus Beckwithbacteria bacterium RBG_13_42_9 TaxID=1797457 RepID=A0A1F5E8Z2_9BACT|nr:MAG: hypothetical protein A2160_01490 [Candidatus Beckwithbacteria bacterium RBG_13_42_9]